ncbi:MAG: hypothetical protein V3T77_03110, partial [Planctomycetota bacterium]
MHCIRGSHYSSHGMALISVSATTVVAFVLTGALLSVTKSNSKYEASTTLEFQTSYLAQGALSAAFAEVASQVDNTGNGLGAIGVNTPVAVTDGSGNVLGEYRSFVRTADGLNIIVAIAAAPSFADPESISVSEAFIGGEITFPYIVQPGAISIAGPIQNPQFTSMGSDDLIDGGANAAIALTSDATYATMMDQLGDQIWNGEITGNELQGGETTTYEHTLLGDLTLPVTIEEQASVGAAELDAFRNHLRSSVLSLEATADQVITTPITGDQVWGDSSNPKVVVIDAGMIGAQNVFDTWGQTIRGHGTLIIKHTCKPKKDLNLDWTGDIYVLGFDGDGADLLYGFGTQGTIDGNLILLSSDHTEASLELADTSRPSNLVI